MVMTIRFICARPRAESFAQLVELLKKKKKKKT